MAITQPTPAALIPRMVTEKDFAEVSGIVPSVGQIGIPIAPALACWPVIRREMRSETRQPPPTSMRDEIGDNVAA